MDTKENNPGADRREVSVASDEINPGDSVLVTNFDSYSTTQTLPVTLDMDGAVVNYNVEARNGDIIWSAPEKDRFYYGVPLKPEFWQYQAVNEVGGAFVSNFVSEVKHKVFLVFSNSNSVFYKSSLVTHTIPIPKWRSYFGADFTANSVANTRDLVSYVIVDKIAYGFDSNENSYLINPSNNSVQRVDREWFFQGRDGNKFAESLSLKIETSDIFGLELVEDDSDLDYIVKRLIFLGKNPALLEAWLEKFITEFKDKTKLVSQEAMNILETAKRNLMIVFTSRFTESFIENCKKEVLRLAANKRNQPIRLLPALI